MSVRDDWHNRRVGTRLMEALIDLADHWLGALRIELTVYVSNEHALRLYRNFGFEIEGTHRAYSLRDGEYTDTYAMARLHPHPPRLPGSGTAA
jgi:putative acetyltransferase